MWDEVLKFLNDNKDALGLLFGSGVVLAILGAVYRFIVWLIKEYRSSKTRSNNTFPFRIIPPNSDIAKEIYGKSTDPVAPQNIPYQARAAGRNIRREIEELLEKNRWVLMLGVTGIGKTREAINVLQVLNGKGWTILYLTRNGWLDAPAFLPPQIGTDRKILFFLDDLHIKCYASQIEQGSSTSSLIHPLSEPLQERLLRMLSAYEILCGKKEILVLGVARNETEADIIGEPSPLEKLEIQKFPRLWNRFTQYELTKPEHQAQVNVFKLVAKKARIKFDLDEILQIVHQNDGTFSNILENISIARVENHQITLKDFRPTLRGTFHDRYFDLVNRFPATAAIYDAIKILLSTGIQVFPFLVEETANLFVTGNILSRRKKRREIHVTLERLVLSDHILEPLDGQIEAKGTFPEITVYLVPITRLLLKLANRHGNLLIPSMTNFGNHLQQAKLYELAITLWEKALKISPNSVEILHELASDLSYTHHKEKAISICEKIISLDSDSGITWYRLGKVYSNLGLTDDSFNAHQKALQVDPDNAEFHDGLADVYWYDKRDYEQAIPEYQKAIELDPDYFPAYHSLGEIFNSLGHSKEAANLFIAAIERSLDLGKDFFHSTVALGEIFWDQENYDSAIKLFQLAIELDPKDHLAWDRLGLIYQKQGRYQDAIMAYSKVIEITPDFSICYASMAFCFSKLNNDVEANRHISIARSKIENQNEYNQACFEAICGNTDKSLELLSIALAKKQQTKREARRDPDFDSVRDDPRFQKLVDES